MCQQFVKLLPAGFLGYHCQFGYILFLISSHRYKVWFMSNRLSTTTWCALYIRVGTQVIIHKWGHNNCIPKALWTNKDINTSPDSILVLQASPILFCSISSVERNGLGNIICRYIIHWLAHETNSTSTLLPRFPLSN